jgi:hypothetical protein
MCGRCKQCSIHLKESKLFDCSRDLARHTLAMADRSRDAVMDEKRPFAEAQGGDVDSRSFPSRHPNYTSVTTSKHMYN